MATARPKAITGTSSGSAITGSASSEQPLPSPSASQKTTNSNTALWITYINIILYAAAYQLQRPIEPFVVSSLTTSGDDYDEETTSVSTSYARLQSFFSAIQTIGAPLVGILLDRIGVRQASAIVFLSSALSYGILANATSLSMLFWSKVPTAFQAAFLIAQATAATSTGNDSGKRAQALARMTTAYTIGATLGPALGGYLVERMNDLYLGAKLAVVLSLVSVVLSLLFLPDSTHHHKTDEASSSPPPPQLHLQKSPPGGGSSVSSSKSNNNNNTQSSSSFLNAVKHSYRLALRPRLWPLLLAKVVSGVVSSMYGTALPLVLTQHLGFEPSQLGLTMSSSMFAVAIFGAFLVSPLVRMMGPSGMATNSLVMRAVTVALMASILMTTAAFASTTSTRNDALLIRVAAVGILHSLASHALATGLTTQTTGAVQKEEQGSLLGLEHSLFSVARIGAPPLGTALLMSSSSSSSGHGSGSSRGIGGFWTVAAVCGTIDVGLAGLLVTVASSSSSSSSKKKISDGEHTD